MSTLSGVIPVNSEAAPLAPAQKASAASLSSQRPETDAKERGRWTDSRELSLALGLFCGKYLLNMNHLHYGYWPEGLSVKLSNFTTAQQHLADFILAHIPPGVSSILDVGCGAGALAADLLSRGYSVDCVCPNPVLLRHARKRLNGRARIYHCAYEALEKMERRYDLVLFSESFQYVRMHQAIRNARRHVNPGGYILICDFFKTNAPGECIIGGGRRLTTFYELIARHPLQKIEDIDITAQTAPTIDLLNNFLVRVSSIWNGLRRLAARPGRLMPGGVRQRVAHKLDKLERKYFSGLRTARHFATFKAYRLLLYRVQR